VRSAPGASPTSPGRSAATAIRAGAGRRCLGADVCANPQPGGGCAGRTFAPEIEGAQTGGTGGAVPVRRGNPGNDFGQNLGNGTTFGEHVCHFWGTLNPVIPRIAAPVPRIPHVPQPKNRERTRGREFPGTPISDIKALTYPDNIEQFPALTHLPRWHRTCENTRSQSAVC
jgi:hypothetical protein